MAQFGESWNAREKTGTVANSAVAKSRGSTPRSITGTALIRSVHGRDSRGDVRDPGSLLLESALSELSELKEALVSGRAAEGPVDPLVTTVARLRERFLGIAEIMERASHSAYHDDLTGLPNRNLLDDRLRQAIVQALRQGRQVAVIMLDLNGFKAVNDTCGHLAGDRLLKVVASTLSDSLRGCDTACRYGGDEFVIMLPEVMGRADAMAVMEKIHARLGEPVQIEGRYHNVSASMGLALSPEDGDTPEQLIRRADAAMYRAKARVHLSRNRAPRFAVGYGEPVPSPN